MAEKPHIPGYRLLRELGSGGMATVYLAVQEKLNREVAVKVLAPALQADRDFAARFVREARTAANLRHNHIVAVHDVGRHGSTFFFVMEHLPESLKDRILMKFNRPFTPREVLAVLGPIAAALDYAHRQGVVHRDIKPDNVMFRADGTPVLVDFGLAKAEAAPGRHTDTRLAIGTPHYMSPEQGMGKPLDARSDLYSLGIVLHEMLTGRVPYDADSAMGVVFKHVQDPLPVLPAETSLFQPLLDSLLAKEPGQRPASAAVLNERLEQLAGEEHAAPRAAAARTVAAPPAAGRPLRRLVPLLLAALALLAFAAGFLLNRHDPAAPAPVRPASATTRPAPRPAAAVDSHAVYLDMARADLAAGNRDEARRHVEQAVRLRPSPEAEALQRRLEEAPPPAPASGAVRAAASAPGRRPPPARSAAPPLQRPAPGWQLRAQGATVAPAAARDMLRRFGFFDRYENPRGGFANRFRRTERDGRFLVEDQATGLAWLAGGSERTLAYAAVPAWLAALNGGGGNWRLPTLEEAASLLAPRRAGAGLHVDPLFSADIVDIWTADRVGDNPGKVWVVLFGDGCLGWQTETARCFVRPVCVRRP